MKTYKEFMEEASQKYHSIDISYDNNGEKRVETFNTPAKNKQHAIEKANKEYEGKKDFTIHGIRKSHL
jgi:transposase-like protein